jgi:trans-aconitate methyltransferase
VRDRQGDPSARAARVAHHLRRAGRCALAAAARENLTGFDVDVVEARFEDWTPAGEPLAMVFAATSWHWIEPTERYPKAADLLEPRGYLAL